MSRTALILGAGPNIGAALSNAFSALNYKIALASRSADASADTPNKIHVKVDLSHPESVKPAFEQVEKKLGVPSVVVYNGTITLDHTHYFIQRDGGDELTEWHSGRRHVYRCEPPA
jgi:NAD(P)-dependent dehydrogenase (short-subunit alcohol dehydrogenase family)